MGELIFKTGQVVFEFIYYEKMIESFFFIILV